ncbi:XdhC family protein [Bacteroidota bacterium]
MIDIYKIILELYEQGRDAVLCTIISTKGSTPLKEGAKMIVTEDKTYGTVGGGATENETINIAKELLHTSFAKKIEIELISKEDTSCGGKVEIFIESLSLNYNLYIFGAGHVGNALAEISANIGFDITIIDDRKEIIDEWDVQECNTKHSDFKEYLQKMKFDVKTFIAIMTYEHKSDWDILSYCINKPWAYLGMMGSKSKVKGVRKKLIDIGVKDEVINKIDMPIGIEINSESAKEIAISIVAKLIAEKNSLINKLEK